jgi:hypothetical protein
VGWQYGSFRLVDANMKIWQYGWFLNPSRPVWIGLSKFIQKPTQTRPNRTDLFRFDFGFVYLYRFLSVTVWFRFFRFETRKLTRIEFFGSVLISSYWVGSRFEFFLFRFSGLVGFGPMLTPSLDCQVWIQVSACLTPGSD